MRRALLTQPQIWPTTEQEHFTCSLTKRLGIELMHMQPQKQPMGRSAYACLIMSQRQTISRHQIFRALTNLHRSLLFFWSLLLLSTSMLRKRACGMPTMFFWILAASKRANCKPCSLSTPRHGRRTAAGSSSLIETCRITNGFFDYKGDESSLIMHSRISTILFYSTTGLLNKSIHSLIFLLKTTTSSNRLLLL